MFALRFHKILILIMPMEEISTLFYVLDGIFNNSKQNELFSTEYVFDDAELLKSLGKLDY